MSKTVNKLKHNPVFHNAFMLGIFCIVAGLALGLAYESTKNVIAEKKETVTLQAFESVFGEEGLTIQELEINPDFADKDLIEKVVYAKDFGYAVEIIGKGYKGDAMEIVVGYSLSNNQICGVQLVSHSETAGLGANAAKPSFLNQFIGFDATSDSGFSVVKNGADEIGEIDALGGATKTSRGVCDAVNMALDYIQRYLLTTEGGANHG